MKKNTRLNKYIAAFCVLFLTGCGYKHDSNPHGWLKHRDLSTSMTPANLTLCVNFGCTEKRSSAFSQKEWQEIQKLFIPTALSAEQERDQIAQAIALMERQQGPKVGTQNDEAENGFGFSVEGTQLDCVAETTNTSIYLMLLEQSGMLKFHTVTGHAHRGPFTLSLPHNTATVREKASDRAFAIDSWFEANGELPWVTPVENWLSGASP